MPQIAYVPPFSGLEPLEKGADEAALRQKVGTGQPGSVLRNLLLRVSRPTDGRTSNDWESLRAAVKNWFSVILSRPDYDPRRDVYISVEYRQDKKNYDIIAGGSGFHQTLTLLAFLYGYKPTTILLDEPDAHLHVNLQREIIDFFKNQSQLRNIQFIVATHAEEFVRGVDPSQIISLLDRTPQRVISSPVVLAAMAEITNDEVTRISISPYVLYVEGETDERIIRAWAGSIQGQDFLDQVSFKSMGGGSKKTMKANAETHFMALQVIIPAVKRLMIFDFDSSEVAYHPEKSNPSLFEWTRKNIENYLLVPDAWKRAALQKMGSTSDDLFTAPIIRKIENFFVGENLTLPASKTWQTLDANVFKVVDGKKMLFETANALFYQLRELLPTLSLPREDIARTMLKEEVHSDVVELMEKIASLKAS